jgi:F0F1-type ATP synthase beta subunit
MSLDRRRALANLYPSIDPCRSLTGLTISDLADDHLELLSQVKFIFSAYDARDPSFTQRGDDHEDHRVELLVDYFTQPFKVTEPFRGTPGESVGREALLNGVRSILASKKNAA